MKIYNYNPVTYEYIGEQNADLDPQETKEQGKDIYLIPANATAKKPPVHKEDKARVWQDGGWVYVADYRLNYYKVDSSLFVSDITELGELEEGYILVTKELGELVKANPDDYVIDNNEVRAKTEEEKQAEADAEFNKQFFNTSLGYVRRKVTMKDGSTKDFLSDILPLLAPGVPVLTYTRELEQSKVIVTEQFINECKQQVLIDFYGGIE